MNSKTTGILLLLSLLIIPQVAECRDKNIYHHGWIDFNKNGMKDLYEDPSKAIDDRVEDLLSQMSVNEKTCQLATLYGYKRVLADSLPTVGWDKEVWHEGIANIDEQLNGVGAGYRISHNLIVPFANHVKALNTTQKWFVEKTRLGIPAEFSNEGIHGLNHTKATPLPAPIGIGTTWNTNLVNQAGHIVGNEAKLLGYHSVYAPILDLARDPRWGRVLECYGEDPYLVGALGTAMADGVQSEHVAVGLKHYAAYSVPKGGRDGNCRTDPHITPRELHEIFLKPFGQVIKSVQPMIVMASYNDWNGEPVIASNYFLTDVLRNQFGFRGYVVSDSEAVEFVQTKHHTASTYDDAVRQCLEAGLNVRTNFTQPAIFINAVRRLIRDGKISMDVIDQRVREVLRVKFRMGLFDQPYIEDEKKADKEAGADKQTAFIEQMGLESMVLLKNNGVLPLNLNHINRILVTGPLAKETNYMTSRYGPNGLSSVSVFDGLKNYVGNQAVVEYQKGCNTVDAAWPESEIIPQPISTEEQQMIDDAVSAAENADVVIAVVGEDVFCTGESRSRSSLDLPGHQRDLLMALHRTGKPVVMVMVNGQPLTINWENKYLPAILETWFSNYRCGDHVAKILFGDYNPDGKLPITFPESVGEIELNFPYKKGSHAGQHKDGPNGQGYTRVVGALYPFGYGLSYTTFSYSNLRVNTLGTTADSITIDLTVKNTGNRKGKEIVQLYMRDEVSSVVTYESQLRGFKKIELNPNESQDVRFVLHPDDLALWDKNMKWTVEPGDFTLMVGSSSEDIRLKKTITLK
ncbi:MAG: glycoside hydrolase family 3 N-terminal domain-containing protein [Prevotella sp.]|jgi:beta-glucosidase